MSLKNDYLTGPSGVEQSVLEAFQAGVAFVGTGVADVESLSLGDRNGSNLGAGSATPGTYFDIDGLCAGYRVWFYVAGEVAPVNGGRNLIQVTLLSGDSSSQAAVKIAAALNNTAAMDFSAISVGGSIQSTVNGAKAVNPLTLGASGWGTAVAAVVTAGVNPTGNYQTISNALKSFAQMGRTQFKINLPLGGTPSAQALRSNHGNNLVLKGYFAGIVYAFAGEQIYNYEVKPILNVSDKATTTVDLVFNFSYNQKTFTNVSFDIPPFRQPFDSDWE